ncbi:hypothetical protein AUP40_18025 [Thalassospira xiamenensis]|jgi:uncharacterized protein YbjT (DUF2867 family)|uniref:NAD(P)-binding domain-containing protein n=2 Tax=Thalassospiraceae TaxID=2844866 RepID=A0ABR5Y0N1_9PROT|nr:hypothetical protein AUP40_18025 [Thalassospira xiamenensis]MAB32917.1 hypothetical protein [Thalassospira sp.]OCK06443.1 DoxX family [Thalassospira sp. KO164]SED70011.1 Uncharacterized conserved protein YbjT, contains NAD(P)-binding and DUF2867 domains [Thalassospira permensis]KZD07688.1 hypothetical protein AUP45_18120 [Thalassospira xiamenensis]|tara:strand:+ start:2701 stop:4017 length:1317 start_codon:yes stop_codon:yes gene_type:complete
MKTLMQSQKTVYVLGGYGLIGSACIRALVRDGFSVVGIGRSIDKGKQSNPAIEWREINISTASTQDWRELLSNADIIVNAAGALQNGARDNLIAIHETSIARITEAIGDSGKKFIQISAVGADIQASTDFMRTKARGDQIIMQSKLEWYVLRPSLVIARDAYGGTALLRAASAFPIVNMRIFPEVPVQIVSVDDVADAVVQAASGSIRPKLLTDITADECYAFDQLKTRIRKWLGFPDWRYRFDFPPFLLKAIGAFADILGWFGWRSPLRSNALAVLDTGITGNSSSWISNGGRPCQPLEQVLDTMPATIQERWFSRIYLLVPFSIAILSLFWISSGLIGFYAQQNAQNLLISRGVEPSLAHLFVFGGSVADLLLGLCALAKRTCKSACLAMIGLSLCYVFGSIVIAPDLWLDPMGPMIKVFPGIALSMITLAVLNER